MGVICGCATGEDSPAPPLTTATARITVASTAPEPTRARVPQRCIGQAWHLSAGSRLLCRQDAPESRSRNQFSSNGARDTLLNRGVVVKATETSLPFRAPRVLKFGCIAAMPIAARPIA